VAGIEEVARMGRWFFAAVMLVVGIMYVGLAYAALATNTDPLGQITGALLFLVIGGAAAAAAFSLLRQKRS
jgi:hypothetical protein